MKEKRKETLIYEGGQAAILEESQIKAVTDEDRAVKGDDNVVVGGYSIRFDDEHGKDGVTDLTGQWFTNKTYFGVLDGSMVDVYFHHMYPILSDDIAVNVSKALAEHTFGVAKASREEMGIWVETVLNMRDDYEREVANMVKANKIGWSSGSAGHLVSIEHVNDIDGMDEKRKDELKSRFWYPGRIKRWPVSEHSLTPTPAEPRNMVGMDNEDRKLYGMKSLKSGLFVRDDTQKDNGITPPSESKIVVTMPEGWDDTLKQAIFGLDKKLQQILDKPKVEPKGGEPTLNMDLIKSLNTMLTDFNTPTAQGNG